MKTTTLLSCSAPVAALVLSLATAASPAQLADVDEGVVQEEATAAPAQRIAWFGRLDDARAEAARTGRPILMMSAAPQCSGAPGMW